VVLAALGGVSRRRLALSAKFEMTSSSRISVVIPTYQREQVLLDTLHLVLPLLQPGDELVLVDQTPRHEPAVEQRLYELAAAGAIRWFRRGKPHICEAMNAGAGLARGDILLFLDDDVIPAASLLEVHRRTLDAPDAPPAVCGQVLQPWNEKPIERVSDFGVEFNPAYDQDCDILSLMAGNFAIRRETYFRVGGMDERFFGPCYRLETELSHRIFRLTGRQVRFVPQASIRHLHAGGGGSRAFGMKDTWKHIGGSVGDYYFALRSLSARVALKHCGRRLLRAPINRETIKRPWRIPSLFFREVVACGWAVGQALGAPRFAGEPATYAVVEPPARPQAAKAPQV
jgi:GT2 family glycosyltransferase